MKIRFCFEDGTTTLYSNIANESEGGSEQTKTFTFSADISTLLTKKITISLEGCEKGKITEIAGTYWDIKDTIWSEYKGIDIEFESADGDWVVLDTRTPYKFAAADTFYAEITVVIPAA